MTICSAMRLLSMLFVGTIACLTVAGAVLTVLYSSPRAAAEPRFEVLVGSCEYTRGEKGSWWNDYYPTSIDLTTKCGQIGVSDTPWKARLFDSTWNAGWRLAYVDLGLIHTDSVMAMRDVDQFSNPDGSQCDPTTNANCLMRTTGGGRAQGISIGGLLEHSIGDFADRADPHSGLVFGAEAGFFLYHNGFDIDIEAHPAAGGQASTIATSWDLADGWLATTYLGANLRFADLFIAGRIYQRVTAHKTGCGGCSGITKGPAYQLNVGISLPF